jgi:octaprenyl-diphosphate synthase
MALPVDAVLSDLQKAAHQRAREARLSERLAAVQNALKDDLSWVEQTLLSAVESGPRPATDAARHLVSLGGKRVRPLALLLSAACFGPVPVSARELAVVAELVHSATLLHDDVVDEGNERRGAPTSRRLWGNAMRVLSGDLLLIHALERTLIHAPTSMPALVSTLRRLVEGEIVQLRGRTELDVSESTYEQVLRDKTASLFGWATQTGARLAAASDEHQEQMAAFGERLGMAFQLVDDVLDYAAEHSGKTLLSDLREGKLTLPLVLTVAERPELFEPLARIFAGDPEPVAQVSRAVLEGAACDEVRRRARRQTEKAVEALHTLPPSRARDLLEEVAFKLAERAS